MKKIIYLLLSIVEGVACIFFYFPMSIFCFLQVKKSCTSVAFGYVVLGLLCLLFFVFFVILTRYNFGIWYGANNNKKGN